MASPEVVITTEGPPWRIEVGGVAAMELKPLVHTNTMAPEIGLGTWHCCGGVELIP
jgi:hypothetical protein